MDLLRAYPPQVAPAGALRTLLFAGPKVIVSNTGEIPLMDPRTPGPLQVPEESLLFLGTSSQGEAYVAALFERTIPEGHSAIGVLGLHGVAAPGLFRIALYAFLMTRWERTGRFCGQCGSLTKRNAGDWGRQCPECGRIAYATVNPCTIALIHDGDRVLLAHKKTMGKMWGLVAGFVEPGESVEECLHREVEEEVGLEVDDLRYFGSQPWPFPNQLMMGYFARYAGGAIRIDEDELDDARWFHRDELPRLPPDLSIARRLVDAWATGEVKLS